MAISRSPYNPIISPEDVKPSREDFQVVCVFNAGVIRYKEKILLLMRVAEKPKNTDTSVELVPVFEPGEGKIIIKSFPKSDTTIDFSDSRFVRTPTEQYLSSISHIRIAESTDGIHFDIHEHPAMEPADKYEMFGIEDPRIVEIDDTFYINYSAVSPLGAQIALASTKDFITFQRHGIMFCPDNRDVEIFPEKINGKYYALHRPNSGEYKKRDVWIAESNDLISWGNHRHVMTPRAHSWDNGRVGGSAIPIRVKDGWLEIYHGADVDDRYCLGAVLLDEHEPWKVLARSKLPFIEPQENYEMEGFFGNAIFNCGVLFENDIIKIYYGAADTHICYAEIFLDDVLKGLEPC